MSADTPAATGRARAELVGGLVLIVAWGGLQFGVAPATGWIHLLLAAGVIFVIRGIANGE